MKGINKDNWQDKGENSERLSNWIGITEKDIIQKWNTRKEKILAEMERKMLE